MKMTQRFRRLLEESELSLYRARQQQSILRIIPVILLLLSLPAKSYCLPLMEHGEGKVFLSRYDDDGTLEEALRHNL